MINQNQKQEFKKVFLDNFKNHFENMGLEVLKINNDLIVFEANGLRKVKIEIDTLKTNFFDTSFQAEVIIIADTTALEIGLKKKDKVKTKKMKI